MVTILLLLLFPSRFEDGYVAKNDLLMIQTRLRSAEFYRIQGRYLYDKYASTLRYFSAKYVDDDATIEDVVQDAFLNLWEKRNEFKTESTIKAYLYKIVRSFSVDTIRRRNIANRYAEKIVLEEEDQEFFLENIVESEVFQMIHFRNTSE